MDPLVRAVLPRLGWGYVLLSLFNAILFIWVEIDFAGRYPNYVRDEGWPTISRALAHADKDIITLLALMAAPGLLLGGVGSMRIHWSLWRSGALPGWRGLAGAANTLWAAVLCLPYFFMVTITLSDHNALHMLFSYIFFFGMSVVILFDAFVVVPWRMAHAASQPGDAAGNARLWVWQRRSGWALLGAATAFLSLYLLKNWEWLPQDAREIFQKCFVVSELVWITLAHGHALTHWALHRCHCAGTTAQAPIIDPMLVTKGVR